MPIEAHKKAWQKEQDDKRKAQEETWQKEQEEREAKRKAEEAKRKAEEAKWKAEQDAWWKKYYEDQRAQKAREESWRKAEEAKRKAQENFNAQRGSSGQTLEEEERAADAQWEAREALKLANISEAKKRECYELLGVPANASLDEINKAFRTLAKKWHPDRKGGNNAMMQRITEAHDILTKIIH